MYLRFFGGGSETLSTRVDLSGLLDPADRGRVVDLRGRPAPERRGVPGMGAIVHPILERPDARSGRIFAGLGGRVWEEVEAVVQRLCARARRIKQLQKPTGRNLGDIKRRHMYQEGNSGEGRGY